VTDRRFVGDLADHHATALEAIHLFGARHPRQAINMLMFCSIPRMQHAYSMVPWDIACEHYARAHSLILTTAAEILVSGCLVKPDINQMHGVAEEHR
jgi:hypothetical protein